ncbi:MAG: replication and repair protein RecO [Acidimicrobiales bacterium]|jgi:DNA repair protein RecO (recombination protein O)|nr:replication and repair protein RecO [Acidimicrobiales bacterium]
MAIYREEGIVLRTMRLGESDKIVTIVTRGRGKVRAVAKGVRKTKSRFGGRLEPLTHVALQLYEGRNLDTITQVETIDHFKAIREDLDRLTQATTMLEVVDAIVQEGEENPRLHQMLLGALRTLEAQPSPLVVPAFFWKLLAQEGYRPILDRCASCGSVEDLVAFDLNEGGTLCRNCARGTRLTPEALGLLRRILGGDLVSVLAEPPTQAGYEVEHLATRALEHHLERRMRSVGILD